MKWANSFAECDGLVGPQLGHQREYDGQYVQINDAFIGSESDKGLHQVSLRRVPASFDVRPITTLYTASHSRTSSTLMAQGLKTRAGQPTAAMPTSSSQSWTNTTYIVSTYRYDVEPIQQYFK